MKVSKRTYLILGVLGVLAAFALVGMGAAAVGGSSSRASGAEGVQGQIDDGAELLDQASISLEEAIAAAQSAAEGDIGEIDLEKFEGTLVFNVDVGALDVKVDASNGVVIGQVADDEGGDDKDD